jgi:hypothetical protein
MQTTDLKLINAITKVVALTLYYLPLHFQLAWYVAHARHMSCRGLCCVWSMCHCLPYMAKLKSYGT